MADIVSMSQADLERLVDARLRSLRDGTNPQDPANGRGEDTASGDRAPVGTAWRGSVNPTGQRNVTISADEARNVMSFFRGVRENDSTEVRRASEALRVNRLQSVGVVADGGHAVPEQFVSEVLVVLPRLTPFADSSLIRIVPMDSETMRWTKVVNKPGAPVATAEGAQYSKSKATFAPIELVARKLGLIIPFTEEIIMSNQIGMVQLLAELVAEQFAYKQNALITSGSGTGEPEGVLTAAGVTGVPYVVTNDQTRADSVITQFHALPTAYRRDAIWLMNDASIALVRKLKDTQGRYLWTDGFNDRPATLLGRPVFENPDLPINGGVGTDEHTTLFGNFKRGYIKGVREGMDVSQNSSGTDWEKDIVNFKFRERWDGKVHDTVAFVKGTGLK